MMGRENPWTKSLGKRGAVAEPASKLENLGPYRVAERLGSGGMGEVYKAYDERLERWVAIKRIRPDKETAEEHRERLRREARAAARINHPAIVHVYDIFEHEDADCIVMELVEGTSFDRLIQHGPLDPFRVADLGRQIANGLAEAHSKGILHRDLKTENVIVTTGDQAKILDFGLAKPLIQGEFDAALTAKGQVVGTSRTMSPEYVSGDDVDHRSDLFSLGVLLYEASTGKSPFKAHNTLATLKRIILHRQPPAHEVNPAVPEALSAIINQLLEKEPEDRPQSATEVAEALSLMVGASSSNVDRPGSTTGSFAAWPPPKRSHRRWWLIAATIVGALAFTFWLGRQDAAVQRGSAEEPLLLVLGDFVNQTGDENLAGLNDAFRLGLAQSESITLLSAGEMRESLERMQVDPEQAIDRSVAIEIAQREGGGVVIVGHIDRFGSTSPFILSAEAIDPESGRTVFASKQEAPMGEDVVPALDRVVHELIGEIGEIGELKREDASRKPLERVTTSSLPALKAYSRGVEMFERSDFDQAIALFEEAIAQDPGFAMARAKLGTAYRNSARNPDKAVEHLEKALELEERLTQEESLYVRSWIATLRGRPSDALQLWGTMRELRPLAIVGHHNYAMVTWAFFNRFEDAAQALGRAIEVGAGGGAYHQLGYCRLGLNDWNGARASFEQALLRSIDHSRFGLSDIEFAQGNLEAGARELARTKKTSLSPDLTLRLQVAEAELAFLRGDFDQALTRARETSRSAIESHSAWWEHLSRLLVIGILGLKGDEEEALREEIALGIERAVNADLRNEVGGETSTALLLASLGKLAARNGLIALAKQTQDLIVAQAPAHLNEVARVRSDMLAAEIAIGQGNYDEAAGLLIESVADHDSYTGREALAYLSLRRGDLEASRDQYRWLITFSGRAFAECPSLCFDRPLNIIALPVARIALAAVENRLGNDNEAQTLVESLPEAWSRSNLGRRMIEGESILKPKSPD